MNPYYADDQITLLQGDALAVLASLPTASADVSMFADLTPAPVAEPEKLSADRRRTLRQRQDIEAGRHPLDGTPLNSDPEVRCGDCRFRVVYSHHDRSYGKCSADGKPVSHGAATDVRRWWPGCRQHEYGDPRLSPDAARSGPSSVVSPAQDTP